MTTVASPTSARTSRSATFSTPSGSTPALPVASRRSGTPNSISPPTPAATASAAALRSESRVCWTTPGIDETGTGSTAPSLTNIGSTSCRGRRVVSATRRRSAGVARRRRGRCVGKPIGPAYDGYPGSGRRLGRRPTWSRPRLLVVLPAGQQVGEDLQAGSDPVDLAGDGEEVPVDLLEVAVDLLEVAVDLLEVAVDLLEFPVDLLEPRADAREAPARLVAQVGQVRAHRVQHAVVLVAELPELTPELTDVPVRTARQDARRGGVLLDPAQPRPQLVHPFGLGHDAKATGAGRSPRAFAEPDGGGPARLAGRAYRTRRLSAAAPSPSAGAAARPPPAAGRRAPLARRPARAPGPPRAGRPRAARTRAPSRRSAGRCTRRSCGRAACPRSRRGCAPS